MKSLAETERIDQSLIRCRELITDCDIEAADQPMPSLHQPTSECPCPTGSLQTLSVPLRRIPLPEEISPVGAGKRVAQECNQVEVASKHHPIEFIGHSGQGEEDRDLPPIFHEQSRIVPDGALSRGGYGIIDSH